VPKVQPSKISNKAQGFVPAYAANTHNGTSRNYNEDRISIVLDLKKPGSKLDEPLGPSIKQASFFAVFDGHGGHGCPEFLRDNLHNIIANQKSFPSNPEKALFDGFKEAEETFMRQNLQQVRDKSGSCALVMLIIDNDLWFANTGDSRAVLSSYKGQKFTSITNDHKPSEESERKRIIKAGGQVYQNNNIMLAGPGGPVTQGPVRVLPGRLSVSRTFGDC